EEYYIAKRDSFDVNGNAIADYLTVRKEGEYPIINKNDIEVVDVDAGQIAGLGISAVPFLDHDDGSRALMGANMQRQSLPGIKVDKPIVGTGVEEKIALDTKASIIAKDEGIIKEVDKDYLTVEYKNGDVQKHWVKKFERTNDDTNF